MASRPLKQKTPGRSSPPSAPQQAGRDPEDDPRSIAARIAGPLSISLACHALLITLLGLLTWAVGGPGDGLLTDFDARLVTETASAATGFRFPGDPRTDRPDPNRTEEAIEDLASLLKGDPSLQVSPVDVGASELKTLAVNELSRSDVVGASVLGSSGAEGLTGDLGDRDLTGGGPVGSMWGVGKGQQARSIVYVMDRSGSMTDTFTLLQRELLRAIGSLEPEQLFNVIWFNEGRADEWSKRLRKATLANKRSAFEAIKAVVPAGQTDPVDAVRRSLAYRPDVMFLLSDGDFGEENKHIIDLIRKRNSRKRTIINTILFVYDTMGEGEQVLRTIAGMNKGTYKHVTEQDINRR